MFDIGFLEIIVILIITLLVVGPERMPEIARKAGQFIGKMRNFINTVKDDSNLRDTVRELQQAVDIKEEQQRFNHIQQDLFKGFDDVRDQINFDELQRPFGNPEPSATQLEQARQQVPPSATTTPTPPPVLNISQTTNQITDKQTTQSSASSANVNPTEPAQTNSTTTK